MGPELHGCKSEIVRRVLLLTVQFAYWVLVNIHILFMRLLFLRKQSPFLRYGTRNSHDYGIQYRWCVSLLRQHRVYSHCEIILFAYFNTIAQITLASSSQIV